jgi:hypothetical protein
VSKRSPVLRYEEEGDDQPVLEVFVKPQQVVVKTVANTLLKGSN